MTYSVRDYWLPFPEYERSADRDKSVTSAEQSRPSRTAKQSDESAAPLSRWAGAFGAVVGAAFGKKRE